MDIYLLQLLWSWLSVFCVAIVSFFNFDFIKEEEMSVRNTNYNKTATVINEVVNYKTEYVYNNKKPANSSPTVIKEGEYGLVYKYQNGESKVFKNAVNKVVEIGTAKATEYTGRLTGYTPYCVGCSKTGTVACKAKGKKYSLISNGQYYVDSQFGKVRIVAAALNVFPCGTIVHVDNGKIPPFDAIVLDTGGTMRQAMKKGVVWMDLAYSNPKDSELRFASAKNVKYKVKRWGW